MRSVRVTRLLCFVTVSVIIGFLAIGTMAELHDSKVDESNLPVLQEASNESPLAKYKIPDSWKNIEENDFTNPSSWQVFNAERARNWSSKKLRKTTSLSPNGTPYTMVGYSGVLATPDERYVIYIPDGVRTLKSANFLRYDTESDFDRGRSWQFFNADSTSGIKNTTGYMGGTVLGDYLYFAPLHDGRNYSAKVLRYNWNLPFNKSSSWEAFDAAGTDGISCRGYCGAVAADPFVFFIPCANQFNKWGYHSEFLRYDSSKPFNEASSWAAFDAAAVDDAFDYRGFHGGIYIAPYIYFAPFRGGETTSHGYVIRYNVEKDFKDISSWEYFDANNIDGLDTRGYAGVVHVGSHLYFVPQEDKLFGHGRILRYDLRKEFKSASSWEASDIGELPRSKQAARGFHYATTWGPYIYFVPHYDISVSGHAVRYDTRLPFKYLDSYKSMELTSLNVFGNEDLTNFQGAVTVKNKIYYAPARFRFFPRLNIHTQLPEN